nr:immunoglobulin light chain junction region [Mus musculus]
CAQNLELTWTF